MDKPIKPTRDHSGSSNLRINSINLNNFCSKKSLDSINKK